MRIGVIDLISTAGLLLLLAHSPAAAADIPSGAAAPAPILSPEPSGPPSSFSVGPTVGTDGLGFQVGYRHDASFGGRAKLTVLQYDSKFTADQLRLKGSADFVNGTLMGDWYPFEGGFRVSAGIRVGQNRVKVRAEATDGYFYLNNLPFYAASTALTSVSGKAEYNAIQPVLTIGYEGQPSTALPLLLSIDAGVAYVGTSKVKLSAEGPEANNPSVVSALRAQETSTKRELNKYSFVPVLNVAAVYKF